MTDPSPEQAPIRPTIALPLMPRQVIAWHLFMRWRWRLVAALTALLTLIPSSVIFYALATPDPAIWTHLLEHTLPRLLTNTFWLLSGTGVGVLFIAVPLAWLVAVHDFPGRRFFSGALMLPLALPVYVMAFSQLGLFDYTGPVQSFLRAILGHSRWVPSIRSTGGVIVVMSLALYPYVYLLARHAFATQGQRALEIGQSLGLSRRRSFHKVAIPLARPWIMGGLALALMETLADLGAVSIFNYDTFTTAIYQTWFSLFSLATAKQLASLLILLVFLLVWLEQSGREHRTYHALGRQTHLPRLSLQGWQGMAAFSGCTLVFLFAFILPVGQLAWWASQSWSAEFSTDLLRYMLHSIALAVLAGLLVMASALLLAYAQRRDPHSLTRHLIRLGTLGYAIPGSVLAVGLYAPLAWLDNELVTIWQAYSGNSTHAILKGTLLVMLIAYLARFLAVGYSSVDAAMHRITRHQEEMAQSFGFRGWAMLRRVHFPLLRGGLATAFLMVFVDVMKEMPITLMTRPFDWDTLAVRIFVLTSEGEWERAALPSIAIIISGLLPVFLLSRQKDSS